MANVTGSGPATSSDPTKNTSIAPIVNPGAVAKWGLGIVALWFLLTFLVDAGDTAEIAAALAILIATSVLLAYGPDALRNLGFIGG